MDIRLVFMGTPDFAVPTLVELAKNYQISGVITQPDRPTGRGRKLIPNPVKQTAENLHLNLFQPQNTNSASAMEKIKDWNPDLICVTAFGQILSPEILSIPEHGCVNVHASLLPRWRGASPINAAIQAGDRTTGVTIMKMAEGLDDGPILDQVSINISEDDTAGSLSARLANLGAELLVKTIPAYLQDEIQLRPQESSRATYAGMLKKQDGLLDFGQSAEDLSRKVRAYNPWPGTFTFWNDQRLIIHQVRSVPVTSPGSNVFIIHEGLPAVGTLDEILVFEILQLAGKKKLTGSEFLHGISEWP
jgi:methionyl-tRNA formyltransferase